MKNFKKIFLFCVAYLGLSTFLLAHTQVQLSPSADAILDQSSPSTNLGALDYIQTLPWTTSYSKRSVLHFDLSTIPQNATIISAQLKLRITDTFGQQRTVSIHDVTSSWDEQSVTWSNFNQSFSVAILDETTLVFNQSTQAVFNLTQSVQDIVNGTTTNYGWLIKDKNEDASQARWNFASKENVNTSIRPVLEVDYEVDGNNGGGDSNPVPQNFSFKISPVADAKISMSNPDTNYGNESLFSTYPWLNNSQRSVIKFDLNSLNDLPPGSTIISAKLKMVSRGNLGQNRTLNLHRLQTNWEESTVTWNTINNDYHPQAIATDNLSWTDKLIGEWDVTNEVITYHQGIVPNNGWLLKDETEDNSQAYWHFASKEYSQTDLRPVLEVEYELPVRTIWFRTADTSILNSFRTSSNVIHAKQAMSFAKNPILREIYEVAFVSDNDSLLNEILNNTMLSTVYENSPPIPTYSPSDWLWNDIHKDDEGFKPLWHLQLIEAEKAWSITKGSPDVVIGIFDTNFDLNHPDLKNKYKSDKNTFTGIRHNVGCGSFSHGTAVASFAAAETDGGGQLASIGFNTSFLGYGMSINQALYASNVDKVDVISVSYISCGYNSDHALIVKEILDNGTIIVHSAGNGTEVRGERRVTCPNSLSPINIDPINDIYEDPGPYLKAYDDRIIKVTSTDKYDNHLQNPGVTHSHFPEVDICAPGYNVFGAGNTRSGDCTVNPWPYFGSFNGTSFSTPM